MEQKTKHARFDSDHVERDSRPRSTTPHSKSLNDSWDDTQEFATNLAVRETQSKKSSRSRQVMMCFECNRKEGHFLASQNRWFYSYLIGMTLGLIFLVGPYQCQCCGSKRLMIHNMLNPKYWVRSLRHGQPVRSKKKKRKA